MQKKILRPNFATSNKKQIALSFPPDEYKEKNFNWTIDTNYLCQKPSQQCGCDFCFSLYDFSKKDLFDVFEKLNQYRSWKWRKIEESHNGTSCGKMLISNLDVKFFVSQHLDRLHIYEDELYKIEISGRHRIWGIRKDSVMYLIWNDPKHMFYKYQSKSY